MFTFVRNEK